MKLHYTEDANTDLFEVYSYIAKDSPESATKVLTVIKVLIEHLTSLPYMGKSIGRDGARCIISTQYQYRIFYKVIEDIAEVHILHITHSKRKE